MQRSLGFSPITAEAAQLQVQRIAAEAERAVSEAAAAAEARRADEERAALLRPGPGRPKLERSANDVLAAAAAAAAASSAAAAAAAEAANDDVDEGDDGDEMDIDDNDEGESIYSCDEENDGSDDEGTSKENLDEVIEKPDAAIGVHAGAPTPARSDVDIIRSVLDVNHVGEEHLSVEAISIPPPDILKSVTPVFDTSTSNVTSTVEREGEGEGEVVFWHMGDTTEDLMERARVIALTPIKAEEVVVRVKVAVEVGVEVGVVEVSPEAKEEAQEQEHGLGQGQKQQQELNLTDNTLTTMKSEYDDTRSNMEITRSELDCEKKSE